ISQMPRRVPRGEGPWHAGLTSNSGPQRQLSFTFFPLSEEKAQWVIEKESGGLSRPGAERAPGGGPCVGLCVCHSAMQSINRLGHKGLGKKAWIAPPAERNPFCRPRPADREDDQLAGRLLPSTASLSRDEPCTRMAWSSFTVSSRRPCGCAVCPLTLA